MEEWHQLNFVRKKLGGHLSLEKGSQLITITLSSNENDSNFSIYSLELIPLKDLEKTAKETENILSNRSKAEWLSSVSYG